MTMKNKPFKIRKDALKSTCDHCGQEVRLYRVSGPSGGELNGMTYAVMLTKEQAETLVWSLNEAFEEGSEFQHQKEWRRRHGKK